MLSIRRPTVPVVVAVGIASLMLAAVSLVPNLYSQQAPPPAVLGAPENPTPLYVATFIDLMPPSAATGASLIKQYVLDTRKEPGNRSCIAIAQVAGRANHLIVMEEWQDEAAFHRHESAPHTIEYRSKMLPLIGAPFDEREHFVVE